MRIALGQINMVWEDKKASLVKAEAMIQEAAEQKADLIVFPEMSLTGFTMDAAVMGEDEDYSWTVEQMERLALQHQISIGFGWAGYSDAARQRVHNHFTVVNAEGQRIADYTKIHPFSFGGEADVVEAGDQIVTFPLLGRKLALFVCYDLRFPEVFQAATKLADIVLVIANWPAVRRDHWTTLLRARAIENQAYVVGVNCVGEYNGERYSGDSAAYDAIGDPLGMISDREGVLICELDDRAWSLREKFRSKQDRREELYMQLFQMDDSFTQR